MNIESPKLFLEPDPDANYDYGNKQAKEEYKKNLAEQRAEKKPKPRLEDDARYKAIKAKYGPKDIQDKNRE